MSFLWYASKILYTCFVEVKFRDFFLCVKTTLQSDKRPPGGL